MEMVSGPDVMYQKIMVKISVLDVLVQWKIMEIHNKNN
jgi:hypothetical protein